MLKNRLRSFFPNYNSLTNTVDITFILIICLKVIKIPYVTYALLFNI